MFYYLARQPIHHTCKEGDMTFATTADRVEQDSPGVNIMPPTVFYACLILGGVLEFFIPHDFPVLSRPVGILLGLAFGGAGFVFMVIAHEKFKRVGTGIPTNLPATHFVVQGAYRISRNPMYVGGSAFFLGIGLVVGSLWILAAYLPLGLYLWLYVIPREEAYMERVFGDEYRAYCQSVRRWL
jgi:protein-S-isoprenylcysteine O-methyltransferase Ste14